MQDLKNKIPKHLFGFSGRSAFFEKTGKRIGQGIYIFLSIVGTIMLTLGSSSLPYDIRGGFSQISGSQDFFFWLINPVFMTLYGGGLMFLGGKGIYDDTAFIDNDREELRRENAQTGQLRAKYGSVIEDCISLKWEIKKVHQRLVETWLKGLFKEFDLDTHCRISVYYAYAGQFNLLARFSKNPVYSGVRTQKFPINKGVISKAWQHSEYVENKSPEYEEDEAAYASFMGKHYGYDEDRIQNLTMKSCFLFGKAIADADKNVGVILFESDKRGKFSEGLLDDIRRRCDEFQSYMAEFVRDAINYDSTLKADTFNNEAEKGFFEKFKGGQKK